jgi:hypothetical protein
MNIHGWPRDGGMNQPEPAPTPGEGDVWAEVIKDMEARRLMGIQKYGTPLQTNNGRNALVDAYQEALDLAVYLRQALMEQGDPMPPPPVAPSSDI